MVEMTEKWRDAKGRNMLESVVNTLDGLDESLASHYKQVEGVGYVLDTKPYVTDEVSYGNVDTLGLKKALDSERKISKELKGASEMLEKYKALGDPEGLSSKLDELSNSGLKVDEAVTQVTSQFQAKLDALSEEKSQMQAKFEGANHSREITALMNSKASDIADGAGAHSYFEGIVKNMTKIGEDGKIVVVDSLGNELTSRNPAEMGPMSLDELWSTLKSDPVHGFALKPSGASGAGTTGSSGGTPSLGAITDAKSFGSASKEAQVAYYNSNPTQASEFAAAHAAM